MAGLLGYRLAAMRAPTLPEAAAAAASYAAVIAIVAAALRVVQLQRLLGPALLVLVLYLWSAFRGGPRGSRRDPWWVVEIAALALLGAIVIAWNLVIRT